MSELSRSINIEAFINFAFIKYFLPKFWKPRYYLDLVTSVGDNGTFESCEHQKSILFGLSFPLYTEPSPEKKVASSVQLIYMYSVKVRRPRWQLNLLRYLI